MLVTQDGGRMILLIQQVKKSILSHYQLDINKWLINLPMLQITLCHVLTFYFVLTKIKFKIIELMCQSLTNVLIILSLVRLTSMYHSLQYMSMNSEIIVRQMWKISKKQYLTLIRVKLLKIFPQIKQLNTLTKYC